MDLEDGRLGSLLERQDSLTVGTQPYRAVPESAELFSAWGRAGLTMRSPNSSRTLPRPPESSGRSCSDGLNAARTPRRGLVRDARANAGSLKSMTTETGLTIATVPWGTVSSPQSACAAPRTGSRSGEWTTTSEETADASVPDSLRTPVNAEKTLCKSVSLGGLGILRRNGVTASMSLYIAGFLFGPDQKEWASLSGPGQRGERGKRRTVVSFG